MGFQKTQTKQNKNKPKCNLGMFRKENRLVSSPECLGLFNPDVMYRLETKQIKEIIVNNPTKGYFFICPYTTIFRLLKTISKS